MVNDLKNDIENAEVNSTQPDKDRDVFLAGNQDFKVIEMEMF